jgi:hypothetical protein
MGRGGKSGGGAGRSSSSHSSSSRSFSSRSHSSSSSSSRGSSSTSASRSSGSSIHRGSSGSSFGSSNRSTTPSRTSRPAPPPISRPAPPPSHSYYDPRPVPPPRPPVAPPPVRKTVRTIHYNSNDNYREPRPTERNSGCLNAFLVVMAVLCFIFAIAMMFSKPKSNVTVSTVNREPLLSSACVESPNWFEDNVDWIANKSILTSGLKKFYQKTGVQPYLIITDQVNGKGYDLTDSEAELYLENKYNALFNDEGHLIFLFMEYESGEYKEYIYAGNQASSVIDNEAQEMIYDMVDYYYTSDLEEDAYFATSFDKVADRIMRKTTTNKDITKKLIGVVGFIGGIAIVGIIIINKKKYEAQKASEDRKILETPINNLTDESLKDKYK